MADKTSNGKAKYYYRHLTEGEVGEKREREKERDIIGQSAMVAIQDVQTHNDALLSRRGYPGFVALLTGATRGIGAATLRELATHLAEPTIYVVGRSETKWKSGQDEWPNGARIIFIEADITRLREIDRICDIVSAAETKLDLLFMSQGFIPVSGPDCM